MLPRALSLVCLLGGFFLWSGSVRGAEAWEQVCPGGGGRFMYPAFDASDAEVLFCSSDMGPCYRSGDRGGTWRMYPSRTLQVTGTGINGRGSWSVDPHAPGIVWVGADRGLFRSNDHGKTWEPLDGPWRPEGQAKHTGPLLIEFSRKTPGVAALYFRHFRNKAGVAVCFTRDHGNTWTVSADLPMDAGTWNHSGVRALQFDPRDDNTLVVFGTRSLLRTRDGGATWEEIGKDLPVRDGVRTLYDATGGYDGRAWRMYASTKSVPGPGEDAVPGVFFSVDGGERWQPVGGKGLSRRIVKDQLPEYELIQADPSNPNRIYVTLKGRSTVIKDFDDNDHANVYRSDDGGNTWQPLLYTNTRQKKYNVVNATWTSDMWGWAERPTGLAVDPADSDRILVVQNGLYLSENGGRNWQAVHSAPMEDTGQLGGGMPIMSSWAYNFDPSARNRHYLSLTDYCGFASTDSGRTWRNILDAGDIQRQDPHYPWLSNIYNMAFDPRAPGRVWAAASAMHDIPFYTYREKMHAAGGGVVVSEDGGNHWRIAAADKSLPNAAITDVLLFPGKNGGADTLFAAAMGQGVYASEDGGKTWARRNNGFDEKNPNILRIRAGGGGMLYALCTIYMKDPRKPVGGSVYVSKDRGQTWRQVFSREDSPYPVNVTPHPEDRNIIAVSVFDRNWQDGSGGLWVTRDAGGTWERVLPHCVWNAAFSPSRSGRMYAAMQGDGLKVSDDAGKTWRDVVDFPYWRPTGVYFDPAIPDVMYVTSFGGGVYKGYESRIPPAGAALAAGSAYPTVTLRNGAMRATLYAPDAVDGFYRAERFDWSSMAASVETGGHRYFGAFRAPHDPYGDDAASGPAEEFDLENPPGYVDAAIGETFLKIGVGHLVRVNQRPYWARRKFVLADGGAWTTTRVSDREVRFEHDVPVRRGYGYRYVKTVSLHSDEPLLTIRHDLRNIGDKKIDTVFYAHNFVVIDGQAIGPEYRVEFPFAPTFSGSDALREPAYLEGTTLRLRGKLAENDLRPLYTQLSGFAGLGAAANDFTICHDGSGASVRVSGDRPFQALAVYGQSRGLCVEPFSNMTLDPGVAERWVTRYRFR